MQLSNQEEKEYETILLKYKSHEKVQELKNIPHHGNTSIYDHCEHVARYAYFLALKNKDKINMEDLLAGAFLHDFYLYDWHKKGDGTHRFHGFKHPFFAYYNAKKYFDVNLRVMEIITAHMWPLTFLHFPKSREAILVCYADKYCTLMEAINSNKNKTPAV